MTTWVSAVGARKAGDPFTVLIASGTKTITTKHTKDTKPTKTL